MGDRANNREGAMRVTVLGVVAIGIVGVESFTGPGTRIHSSKGYPVIWGGNGASIGVSGDDILSASLSGAGMKVVKMSMTDMESTVKTEQKLDKVSNRFSGWLCRAGGPCGEGNNRGPLWVHHWLSDGSVGLVACVVRVVTVGYCGFVEAQCSSYSHGTCVYGFVINGRDMGG